MLESQLGRKWLHKKDTGVDGQLYMSTLIHSLVGVTRGNVKNCSGKTTLFETLCIKRAAFPEAWREKYSAIRTENDSTGQACDVSNMKVVTVFGK